jgi:hypothetical protein
MDQRVVVQRYLTDNGTFKVNIFVAHNNQSQQLLRFGDTNAHHKNDVAEWAIQSISNLARAINLHSSMHWKDEIGASQWSMEVQYAVHVYNNTTKDGVFPTDFFCGSTVPWHCLLDLHVWRCHVYVIDPTIQGGHKLP